MIDLSLLKELCFLHAPAGEEKPLKDFVLNYVNQHKFNWKVQPKIYHGAGLQDAIVLVFGVPRTAIFAHLDSIGYTVRYGNQLVKLGGPRAETGFELIGYDSKGKVEAKLICSEDKVLTYEANREIERGTSLTFKPNWRETDSTIQCCYMDNRLGMFSALKVAETLEHGIICFSCWEETGGGSAEVLGKFIYENFGVKQALISDITWVTDGVHPGKGCAISMRDTGIPRKGFINRVIDIANRNTVLHQLEVESAGGSDGNALQRTSYPFDWCFVGAPEEHVHSPNELVNKTDIVSMIDLYKVLMKEL